MIIEINDQHTIGELQEKFSKAFPYLRLDFFLSASGSLPTAAMRISDTSITLGSIRRNHSEGEIAISGKDTVRHIEEIFLKRFGLNAQIFRHSGTSWLLTTTTDDLTLNQQNEIAREMAVAVEPEEPADIHEQD